MAKDKSILAAELAKIEKDFGVGSIVSSSSSATKVEVISTGSLKLDLATGIGGLPRGKLVEIMGWESSGKTTISWQTMANAQKQGLKCLYIDGENSFDLEYAKALGIDVDELLIHQLDEGGAEKAYNIAERLMRTREIAIVVIDSQTSLLTKSNFDKDFGESKMGHQARMMSETVPKMLNAAAIGNTLVIYISQFREKIGVMFGSPETTSGGNALKFYAHMRIEVRKSVKREDGVAFANETRCKVIKNKLAAPFGEATFNINFGKGVDRIKEVFDLACEKEIIKQGGAWYTIGEDKVQGEDKMIALLTDNEAFYKEIEKQLLTKIKP